MTVAELRAILADVPDDAPVYMADGEPVRRAIYIEADHPYGHQVVITDVADSEEN